MYRGMAKNMETAVVSGFYGNYFVGPGLLLGWIPYKGLRLRFRGLIKDL